MSVFTRRVGFEFLLAWRQLGAWPWLMLAGWSLFCGGQEPRFLRSYGINLCWQGTESGAAVLLLAVAAMGVKPDPRESLVIRFGAIQAALWTCLIAAGQAALAWMADGITGALQPAYEVAAAAVTFATAWFPAALALVLVRRVGVTIVWPAVLTLLFALIFSIALSAVSSDARTSFAAASGLTSLGVLLTIAALRTRVRPSAASTVSS